MIDSEMLAATAPKILKAATYIEVFGPAPDDPAQHVKATYRRLSRAVHPDRFTDLDDQAVANKAFQRLGQLLADAEHAVAEGIYGQPVVLATIKSRKYTHSVVKVLGGGDLCNTYLGHLDSDRSHRWFYKIARRTDDNDLLQAEATALKRLHAAETNNFVPSLIDSFTYAERGKPNRRANVTEYLDGFYSLAQIMKLFSAGVHPLDMSWMWRRLLTALGLAHDAGVVHGAVVPEHIMIHPELHGLILVDWCYSSIDDNGFAPIKAIVENHKIMYPSEVLAKEPPSAATDIDMGARCMMMLMGYQAPMPVRAFFKGCMQTKQSMRPDNAWNLLQEFDELLERLGQPYYPRRYREFKIPA